jgi:hypothetical protein
MDRGRDRGSKNRGRDRGKFIERDRRMGRVMSRGKDREKD